MRVIFLKRVAQPKSLSRSNIPESPRPAGLDLHAAKPLVDFLDDVVHAQQILIDLLELALGFLLLDFVFGDARGFFKDQPALFGVGFEQRGDAALLDHAVGIDAHAGIQKQLADVLEARERVVDLIFAGAVAKEPPADGHFIDIEIEHARAIFALGVIEDEHDFRHAGRLAAAGAVEDDVHHRVAAQALGGLLAEHPLEAVNDVALAATVGPDDAGDRGIEDELRAVGEALEPVKDQFFQTHVRAVLHDLKKFPITQLAFP